MRLEVRFAPDIAALMREEAAAAERAVTLATRDAGEEIKKDWRTQVRAAGLGTRLGNSIRNASYPKVGESMEAAALVWTNAPQIISAFDRGVTIRSKNGFYLAIPTPAAGRRGLGRRALTPGSWEARTGQRLRFVYRSRGPSLLVADDVRLSKAGVAVQRKSRKIGPASAGSATVPIFLLLPQVRLRKRLDLKRDIERITRALPGMIVNRWEREVAGDE